MKSAHQCMCWRCLGKQSKICVMFFGLRSPPPPPPPNPEDLHPAKLCLLQGSPAKQGALFLHVALLQIHSSPHVQTEVATSRDASESIGENQGTHFEGMHSISIALSGSTALVVAIIIVLWCFFYKKKQICCKSRDSVVSYQMQPAASSSQFIPIDLLGEGSKTPITVFWPKNCVFQAKNAVFGEKILSRLP